MIEGIVTGNISDGKAATIMSCCIAEDGVTGEKDERSPCNADPTAIPHCIICRDRADSYRNEKPLRYADSSAISTCSVVEDRAASEHKSTADTTDSTTILIRDITRDCGLDENKCISIIDATTIPGCSATRNYAV